MKNAIKTIVSKPEIALKPDSLSDSYQDNEFDVTVINNSQKFTSFQIELTAPSFEEQLDENWYRIEPEICSKNPPGSKTDFHIIVTKPPIPAYNKTIDLFIKTFSIEDEKLSNSKKIQLKIGNPAKAINLQLLNQNIKANPGQNIEVPVALTNLDSNKIDVQLEFLVTINRFQTSDLDKFDIERCLYPQIRPTSTETLNFSCNIPDDAKPGSYNFKVKALSSGDFFQSDEGIIEILTPGIIEFRCEENIQEIPNKNTKNSHRFAYKLEFTNNSYLENKLIVSLQGKDVEKCKFSEVCFENTLEANKDKLNKKNSIVNIYGTKQRPLLGWKRQLEFTALPKLESANKVEIIPKTHQLKLNVLPIIPFFWQIIGLISIPLLLLLFNYFKFTGHDAPVTTVRLSNFANTVISGSSDRTIRSWEVNNSWFQNWTGLKFKSLLSLKPEKESKAIKKAIRIIRFRPGSRNEIAVGLENGEVHLWDYLSEKERVTPENIRLINQQEEGNRVFDLEFTNNSQTLIAAYSGKIRELNLNTQQQNLEIKTGFTISSLGISENSQRPLVVVGGNFNKLGFWDWKNPDKNNRDKIYHLSDNSSQAVVGKESYITSLAIADKKNILFTADNKGLIKWWDFNKIRKCISNPENQEELRKEPRIINLINCTDGNRIYNNEEEDFPSIRSIAITKNENENYLVSVGDDKYIRVWTIDSNDSNDSNNKFSCIYNQKKDARFNTVDIKLKRTDIKDEQKELLIATGDDKSRVMLYRISNVNELTGKEKCKL